MTTTGVELSSMVVICMCFRSVTLRDTDYNLDSTICCLDGALKVATLARGVPQATWWDSSVFSAIRMPSPPS